MRYAAITDRLANLGSSKWAIHFRARDMAERGVPVLELTIGEPDVAPAEDLLEACTAAMYAGRTRYARGNGEPALLAALAERYTARIGRRVSEAEILCFPGTQTGLFATMLALTDSGDEVLVADPLYATYDGIIAATGAKARYMPLSKANGFHLTAEAVAAAVTPQSRVLLLNSPHNPTGAVLSRAEIRAIGEVARANDLWIVSDEVYEELVFDGPFASPLDEADLAKRAVAVSSISKSHAAPGFRSGWLVGPAEFCKRLLPVSETMLFGSQPFIADMTAMALKKPDDTARGMREAYSRRARALAEMLQGSPGLDVHLPEAGMFALIDVTGTGLSGEAFADKLLDAEAVALMPGSAFGAQAEGFVRVSLTVPDAVIVDAARRIAHFAAARVGAREAVPAK